MSGNIGADTGAGRSKGMTTYKKGDRVKVTIEGVVIRDQSTRDLFLNDNGSSYPAHHVVDPTKPGVTIEKLADPLPTTPGSVIISRPGGYTRLLHDDGTWHGRFTGARGPNPDGLSVGCWDVLHDAGAQR